MVGEDMTRRRISEHRLSVSESIFDCGIRLVSGTTTSPLSSAECEFCFWARSQNSSASEFTVTVCGSSKVGQQALLFHQSLHNLFRDCHTLPGQRRLQSIIAVATMVALRFPPGYDGW